MLGVYSKKELIKGEFAKKIRDAAWRAATGNYNEEDKKIIEEEERAEREWPVSWDMENVWK